MRTWIICCVLAVVGTMGCGDDENPPASPEIIDARAVCRDVMGVPKLVLVEVHVRDLNGVNDLGDPVLTVEANRLTMEREVIFPAGQSRCVTNEDCSGSEVVPPVMPRRWRCCTRLDGFQWLSEWKYGV